MNDLLNDGQNSSAETKPEPAPKGDQKPIQSESKPKRGGRRPGAGRKPNLAKRLASALKPLTASEILAQVDVPAVFHDIFTKGSRSLKLQAVNALWDRAFGKPKQELGVSGAVTHVHRRDDLASMPKVVLEALVRAYDEVLTKHGLAAADISQEAEQNQPQIKPAESTE